MRHRSHSVEFQRPVAQEFLAGETLRGLAMRHDISRNLIWVWVEKYGAGAFDEDARAADLIQFNVMSCNDSRSENFHQYKSSVVTERNPIIMPTR